MIVYNSPRSFINEILDAFQKIDKEKWHEISRSLDFDKPPLDKFINNLLKHSIDYSYAEDMVFEFQYFTGSIEEVIWFRTDLLLRGKLIVRKIEPLVANPLAIKQMQSLVEDLRVAKNISFDFIIYKNKIDPYFCFVMDNHPKIYQIADSNLTKDILNHPKVL